MNASGLRGPACAHRCGMEFRAYRVVGGDANRTIIPGDAYLDQFVALERCIDFAHHGWRQAGVADQDDRIEVVGAGLEGLAFERS